MMAMSIEIVNPVLSPPPPYVKVTSLMPMTCPAPLSIGPPEFPGLTATSVCTTSILFMLRPVALTILAITVWLRSNGLPSATASQRYRRLADMVGRPIPEHCGGEFFALDRDYGHVGGGVGTNHGSFE